ncbi:MAG: DUF6198 family protein [Streptococcaceae bacterium]|jgi:uncharacterized membrane protein YczE|nr:DUF6198 family protein [Streptococcaceae bacterium]
MYHSKKIPLLGGVGFLALSIFLNAFGNALTIQAGLGSAPWTASAVNLSMALNLSLGTVLIIIGVLLIIVNTILSKEINPHLIAGNLVFIFFFGNLVGFFSSVIQQVNLGELVLYFRLLFDVLGLMLISMGVSIYQRVYWIIHPGDEMVNILRFKYFHGDPVKAVWVNFSIPMLLSFLSIFQNGELYAVNIGTVLAFFFMGALIGWWDKTLFKHLTHRTLQRNAG